MNCYPDGYETDDKFFEKKTKKSVKLVEPLIKKINKQLSDQKFSVKPDFRVYKSKRIFKKTEEAYVSFIILTEDYMPEYIEFRE